MIYLYLFFPKIKDVRDKNFCDPKVKDATEFKFPKPKRWRPFGNFTLQVKDKNWLEDTLT